jgi:phosphoserine aminotransferase
LYDWVSRTSWIATLAEDPATYSNTSVCLRIVDPRIAALDTEGQARFARTMAAVLEEEQAAKDIAFYRDAPPGLRIWTGPTIEAADVAALLAWLDWAFAECVAQLPRELKSLP